MADIPKKLLRHMLNVPAPHPMIHRWTFPPAKLFEGFATSTKSPATLKWVAGLFPLAKRKFRKLKKVLAAKQLSK
jgi:hypothetical protein